MSPSARFIIGIFIILGNATRRFLGFNPEISLESAGYNIFNIGLYVFGFWLIDSAYRGKKETAVSGGLKPAVKAGFKGRKEKSHDKNGRRRLFEPR